MNQYKDINTDKLFEMYQKDKNLDIRDELIMRHLYIAEILSKKYINRGIDYEDIYQVACLGLVYAVDRFDVSKGYKFSSFATPTIVGEIKRYFRDKGWTIRVPRRIQETSKKIAIAKENIQTKLDRVPTISDIAKELDISEEEVIETIEASKVYMPTSLDLELDSSSEDREVRLLDIIGSNDEEIESISDRDFIDRLIEKLNPMEKKIIIDRFFNDKTQMEVANELNVSQMTVSRIEKKIIKNFKKEYKKALNI